MESISPDRQAKVEIYDGTTLLATVTAADSREDLRLVGRGDGIQAFNYALPKALRDGQSHTISARFASDQAQLIGSPKGLICTNHNSLPGAEEHVHTDLFPSTIAIHRAKALRDICHSGLIYGAHKLASELFLQIAANI